ncbi:MAG TPA: phosphate signaling complex protein PhoU [Planctomycetota bacterium]|nr:phosphate signaling complex protein PhoU [Planctomycetota bacterium]
MSATFEHELGRLRSEFVAYAASCLDTLDRAREMLHSRDSELASRVLAAEVEVDRAEVRIEEQCVRLITLHHPVAHDMRVLITILKLNEELERIADHASNVCRLARRIVERGGHIPPELLQLADRVVLAGRLAYKALVEEDAIVAREVVRGDQSIDRLDRLVREEVHDLLTEHTEVESALDSFRMSRELERVGDHLANMGEDVIYLTTGEIVRHHAP